MQNKGVFYEMFFASYSLLFFVFGVFQLTLKNRLILGFNNIGIYRCGETIVKSFDTRSM